MSANEFRQLKKLLMLAANNPSEIECARAFRKATEVLARHGHTWVQAMDRVVRVMDMGDLGEVVGGETRPVVGVGGMVAERTLSPRPPPPRPQVAPRASDGRYEGIEEDFELAIDSASGSFLATLEDIHSQYERNGRLSDAQLRVVRDAAERAADRHPGGRVR